MGTLVTPFPACFKKGQVTSNVLPPLEYYGSHVPKYENKINFMTSACSSFPCLVSLAILSISNFRIYLDD